MWIDWNLERGGRADRVGEEGSGGQASSERAFEALGSASCEERTARSNGPVVGPQFFRGSPQLTICHAHYR